MSKDVWFDLGLSEGEARIMRQRSALMRALNREIKNWGHNEETLCQHFGLTLNELAALRAGHIDEFDLDTLDILCINAGLEPMEIIEAIQT